MAEPRVVLPAPARVIVADPPWRYRNFSDTVHGAAVAHYDTQPVDAIERLSRPLARWAAPSCILALWATLPKLPEAMRTLEAWGFEFVTAIPWIKTLPPKGEIYRGIGFWAMAAAELLVIARRGKVKRAKVKDVLGEQVIGLIVGEPRCFYAPRGRHSKKPLEVHAWLEALLPGPYLELYATAERPGWTCWGRALGVWIDGRGAHACDPVEHDPEARKRARKELARAR